LGVEGGQFSDERQQFAAVVEVASQQEWCE
jgi:hypothetical protein